MSQALSEDSLEQYLEEIGRYRLLTRAEEVQLAKRVERGDDEARRQMIEANLRLVVAIAKKYRGYGVELLDLIQEGTLGLIKAVERYDWRRGTKFSTYASWWIRQGIVQGLSTGARTIRLPESVLDRVAAIQRCETALTTRLGREPTTGEIAAELGLTTEQVLVAQGAARQTSSLDATVSEEGELPQIELLADPSSVDPIATFAEESTESALAKTLATLPERSRRVLELRFGLLDGLARTADAVAAELGVTRERVRQIELHTLRRLGNTTSLVALRAAA